ncbi:MAG: transcriptional regulator [Gammaproteobacteria bacterium]|nr:transcriptional regulator [Gammaproteobacteria bacterium]
MAERRDKASADHPFAYEGLDRVIHERARLSLLTSLVAHPQGLTFAALKQLCDLTDGNLFRHLQTLESEGIVSAAKTPGTGRPQTLVRLTAAGRRRYFDYLAVLETVIVDAARNTQLARRKPPRASSRG